MNLEKYNKVFTDLFDVEINDLTEDFNFGVAPNWNSFAHMELIAELEDTFGIMLDSEDILHFGGYENGKKILLKYNITIE